jgi:nucleotide-binding universal stress UspA family protein
MDEIVVGLDLSVSAQAALAWAAAQAKITGHRVRAIHALSLPATYTIAGGGYIPPVPFDGIDDSYRAAVKAVFDAVQPAPNWELQFMSNDPGPVLVAEAHNASMLVLGTREHTGWGRLRSGSVSHYCLSHAHCPVVAVPVERLASGTAATGSSVSADHSQHSASPVA